MATWKQIASLPPRWVRISTKSQSVQATYLVNMAMYTSIRLQFQTDTRESTSIKFIPASKGITPLEINTFKDNDEVLLEFSSIHQQLCDHPPPHPLEGQTIAVTDPFELHLLT